MKPRFSPSCDHSCVKMADRFVSRRYSLKNKLGDRIIKQLLNSVIAKYRDLSVSRRSIICLSLRLWQIIDLLATDKSRYFAQPRPITAKYFQQLCIYINPTTGIISVKSFPTKPEYWLTIARRRKNITVAVGKTSSRRPQTDASSTPFTPTRAKISTPNEKPEKSSYTSQFTNPGTGPGNIINNMAVSLTTDSFMSYLVLISPHVKQSKDSLGFWIPLCGCWVSCPEFQISFQWNLDTGFQ